MTKINQKQSSKKGLPKSAHRRKPPKPVKKARVPSSVKETQKLSSIIYGAASLPHSTGKTKGSEDDHRFSGSAILSSRMTKKGQLVASAPTSRKPRPMKKATLQSPSKKVVTSPSTFHRASHYDNWGTGWGTAPSPMTKKSSARTSYKGSSEKHKRPSGKNPTPKKKRGLPPGISSDIELAFVDKAIKNPGESNDVDEERNEMEETRDPFWAAN